MFQMDQATDAIIEFIKNESHPTFLDGLRTIVQKHPGMRFNRDLALLHATYAALMQYFNIVLRAGGTNRDLMLLRLIEVVLSLVDWNRFIKELELDAKLEKEVRSSKNPKEIEIVGRGDILKVIKNHLDCMKQWLGMSSLGRAYEYSMKAEALIELLEDQDCGSIGGLGVDTANNIYQKDCHEFKTLLGRYRWLCGERPPTAVIAGIKG